MTGYVISPTTRVVYTFFSGRLTKKDIIQHGAALKADPKFKSSFAEIVDLRGVTKMDLGFAELNDLNARDIDPFSRDSKRAVIAPRGGVAFGITRMWQMVAQKEETVRIFGNRKEAEDWVLDNDPKVG